MAGTPRPWKDRSAFDKQRSGLEKRARTLTRFIAAEFGIPLQKLTGPARFRRLVRARAAIVWVARQGIASPLIKNPTAELAVSFPILVQVLGRSDHSTGINLFRRAEALRERDPDFRKKTDWWLDIVLADNVPDIPEAAEPEPKPITIFRPGPAVEAFQLTACRKAKNDLAPDDGDAMRRLRGSQALLAALQREHPERCAA